MMSDSNGGFVLSQAKQAIGKKLLSRDHVLSFGNVRFRLTAAYSYQK